MTVQIDIQDRLAVVTINRPEVRNALSREVLADLRAALGRLRDDDAVGAVVFTGAGEKAFVAGADIGQLQHYTLHSGLESDMQRLYDEIEGFEKPTIAAVNGFAIVPAGGLAAEARRVAEQILAKGPLAVRLAKLVIRTGMDADQRTGQVVERLAQTVLYTTADKREGTAAFLAKRPPEFEGR